MNDRRRRNELQIKLHNTDYGSPEVPDLFTGLLCNMEMSWFTDEQISDLRRKMIQQDWDIRKYVAYEKAVRDSIYWIRN